MGLEQRILAAYDAVDGAISLDSLCTLLHQEGNCFGVDCHRCPLDGEAMYYLAEGLRARLVGEERLSNQGR